MKKFVAVILSALVVFAFVACDNSSSSRTIFTLDKAVKADFNTDTQKHFDSIYKDGVLTLGEGWQIDLNRADSKYTVAEGKTALVSFDVEITGENTSYIANSLVTNSTQTSMETYPVTISESGTYEVRIKNNGLKGIEVTYNGKVVEADSDSVHYESNGISTMIGVGGWKTGDGTVKVSNLTIMEI